MKVLFDQITDSCCYVLSEREVKKAISLFDMSLSKQIRTVRFGCNKGSTQEARIVQKGDVFDIRINFFLENAESKLLSSSRCFVEPVKNFGGEILFKSSKVKWNTESAKKYCLFLLFHELAHIEYSKEYLDGSLSGKATSKEEKWCDMRARKAALDLFAEL